MPTPGLDGSHVWRPHPSVKQIKRRRREAWTRLAEGTAARKFFQKVRAAAYLPCEFELPQPARSFAPRNQRWVTSTSYLSPMMRIGIGTQSSCANVWFVFFPGVFTKRNTRPCFFGGGLLISGGIPRHSTYGIKKTYIYPLKLPSFAGK